MEVGYRPTHKPVASLRQAIDEVFAPITRPRRVLISRAGDMVKARYEGRRTFVLGYDARHATSRLKTWDGEQ
jgi:hypothetical protein